MSKLSLHIIRHEHSKVQTLGYLYVLNSKEDIIFSCNTLELPYLENKRNISCVPIGEYKCVLEYSDRFKKDLWELKNVPNRSECKFHSANYFKQLNGCIALGSDFKDINSDGWKDIINSKDTMNEFHEVLKDIKEIILTIKDE